MLASAALLLGAGLWVTCAGPGATAAPAPVREAAATDPHVRVQVPTEQPAPSSSPEPEPETRTPWRFEVASTGLPKNLLFVPGAEVTVGYRAKDLVHLLGRVQDEERRTRLAKLTLPELGQATVRVDDFLLDRFEVTNDQYLEFVKTGTHRFPYLWWREGARDDFASRRGAIAKEFPHLKEGEASIAYWEAHWRELRFEVPRGRQHPVTSVSWADARDFAAWCGMRLPTEPEWIHAATAGRRTEYVPGNEWVAEWLAQLQLEQAWERVEKPVGSLGDFARGPFGHEDMMGNVWEWCAENEFGPYSAAAFARELEEFQRDLADARAKPPPDFSRLKRIVKGGSYLSWDHPPQFRIGTRGAFGAEQTAEAIGFRLAKSVMPGRDFARARLSGAKAAGEWHLEEQVGIERYRFRPDGDVVCGYETIAFVPANRFLPATPGAPPTDQGRRQLGALVTTVALANPRLAPGTWRLSIRAEDERAPEPVALLEHDDGTRSELAIEQTVLDRKDDHATTLVLGEIDGRHQLTIESPPPRPRPATRVAIRFSLVLAEPVDPARSWRAPRAIVR